MDDNAAERGEENRLLFQQWLKERWVALSCALVGLCLADGTVSNLLSSLRIIALVPAISLGTATPIMNYCYHKRNFSMG